MIIALAGCAGSKSSRAVKKKKKKKAMIETTHLGKNKLYFSKKYQKSLNKKKR